MGATETIYGVELFQAGTVRGETYDDDFVTKLARNGVKFADRLTPTIIIGHESGPSVPAMGAVKPENLRTQFRMVDGQPRNTLVGDFMEVPKFLADAIRSGNYRTVSAEIYMEPPSDLPDADGPVLRRVAILGGEIPQIKTLADLQTVLARQPATFSERAIIGLRRCLSERSADGKTVRIFSEVTTVAIPKWLARFKPSFKTVVAKFDDATATGETPAWTRDELLAALGDAGFDVSTITDAVPDPMLAEFLRVLKTQMEQQASEKVAEMSSDVKPVEETDEDKKKKEAAMSAETTKYSEQLAAVKAELTAGFASEITKLKAELAATKTDASEARKFSERQTAAATTARIEDAIQKAKAEGRLAPANESMERETLLLLAENSAVRKFSDGVEQTPLERRLAALATSAPVTRFGGATKTYTPTQIDAEKAAVRTFAESNPDLLRANDRTADQYVSTFETMAKTKPGLTAKEFLGDAA